MSTNPLLDPGTFAQDTESLIGSRNDEWWSAMCPKEYAAYRQAETKFEAMVPWLRDNEPVFRAYNEFASSTFDLVMEVYRSGIKQGAAYENLRRSVMGETTGCRECWSVGVTKGGATCGNCGGTGTVALTP